MNLEKLRDLIDNLEIESKQKLFIKEIKNTTVNTLILTLKVFNFK